MEYENWISKHIKNHIKILSILVIPVLMGLYFYAKNLPEVYTSFARIGILDEQQVERYGTKHSKILSTSNTKLWDSLLIHYSKYSNNVNFCTSVENFDCADFTNYVEKKNEIFPKIINQIKDGVIYLSYSAASPEVAKNILVRYLDFSHNEFSNSTVNSILQRQKIAIDQTFQLIKSYKETSIQSLENEILFIRNLIDYRKSNKELIKDIHIIDSKKQLYYVLDTGLLELEIASLIADIKLLHDSSIKRLHDSDTKGSGEFINTLQDLNNTL